MIIGAAVATIVLVSMIPLMTPLVEPPKSEEWYFDDYRPCANDVETSGAFEIVSYDGRHYIHAKDVGTGAINGVEYSVSKAPLEIFVLWGQSNAAYYQEDVSIVNKECTKCTSRAYYFGTLSEPLAILSPSPLSTNLDDCTIQSSANPDGSWRIGNIEAPFESVICKFNEEHSRPYVINVGVGGQRLEYFTQGNPGYTLINSAIPAAISSIDLDHFEISYGAWIMCQGEANTSTSIAQYISDFEEVRTTLSGLSFNEGLIIQTVEKDGVNSSVAQSIIVDSYSGVYWGSTKTQGFSIANGLLVSDDKHYSQKGDNILGADCAETWLRLSGNNFEYTGQSLVYAIVPLVILAILVCVARAALSRS